MGNKVVVQSGGGGIGFLGVLALIFITLKLCGTITWSWWWVLAPLWGPFALVGTGIALGGILLGVVTIVSVLIAAVFAVNKE